MSSTALQEQVSDIATAVRRLGGTATIGDVVGATGIPRDQAEASLKELLAKHRGHLAVSDSGELLYQFDRRLISRDTEPLLSRIRRGAWSAFKIGFKVWIAVTLVVYFLLFVALVIAALVAASRGGKGGGGRGWGGIGRRRRHGGFGDFLFWYWMFGGSRGRRMPYYGRRWERKVGKEGKPPFYKKVFAFVFGPEEPRPTRQQKDRTVLQLIRARQGVIGAAELVEHTGAYLAEAEEEMGRVMGSYAGEPQVTEKGEIVYAFPELMTSAHGTVTAREPRPTWRRLEYPKELTGNDGTSNAIIVGMNAFNLLAASTAPWFLFPRLGIGGTAAVIGLVVVPVVFSAVFFAVPLLRRVTIGLQNRRRLRSNVRRLLLGLVYKSSISAIRWIPLTTAARHVRIGLEDPSIAPGLIRSELERIAAEFDADTHVDADGVSEFRFPGIRAAFVASELTRRELRLEARTIGEIVYSSGDTRQEAHERELAEFDRELQAAEVDLSKYLPSPDRVGYEDDFDVVM